MNAAIILAGGKGTRLGDTNPPKALLEIQGKTLLQWQLEWLQGKVDVIVLALGHRAQEVAEYVKSKGYGVKISIEDSPLGTGGAVKKAFLSCCPEADRVYVLNVDDLARVDFSALNMPTPCIIGKALPYSVWVDGKTVPQNEACQHIGHTILSKADVHKLPDTGSLEKWVASLPSVNSFVHTGLWVTANNVAQLRDAGNTWKL